jgi:hypothetical protein
MHDTNPGCLDRDCELFQSDISTADEDALYAAGTDYESELAADSLYEIEMDGRCKDWADARRAQERAALGGAAQHRRYAGVAPAPAPVEDDGLPF